MMTTSKAFGIERRISDPLMGELVEPQKNPPVEAKVEQSEHRKEEKPIFSVEDKHSILQKAVVKFLNKEISKAELSTIQKVTE